MPLFAVIGMAVIITGLGTLILRSFEKAALIATILAVFVFSYGHLETAITGSKETGSFLFLVIWAAILIICLLLAILTRRSLVSLTRILNLIGAVLICVQVAQAGYVLINNPKTNHTELNVPKISGIGAERPDIYYIILDGYARADILDEIFDYDNSEFVNFLQEQGFYVADSSHANYCQTLLSLTSTLNMDYVGNLGDFNAEMEDRNPLCERLQNNRVFAFLRKIGYEVTAFDVGYEFTELKNADRYISSSWITGEFANILISTTPLSIIFGDRLSPYDLHRSKIEFTLDNLADVGDNNKPDFIFTHILAPHPPFVFEADGSPTRPNRPFCMQDGSHYYDKGGTLDEYLTGYTEQLSYLNRRIMGVIDSLLSGNEANRPIIILHSDHGPGTQFSWVGSAKTNLRERFSILNAVYLPDKKYQSFYDNISPVNLFRAVLRDYFGADIDNLDDLSFYSPWKYPFAFVPINQSDGSILPTLLDYYKSLLHNEIDYKHITTPIKPGTPCNLSYCILFDSSGLTINLDKVYHTTHIELSLDHDDNYIIEIYNDDSVQYIDTIHTQTQPGGGLRFGLIRLPAEISVAGFTKVRVRPYGGDEKYGLGHIRLGTPKQRGQ